MLNSIQEAKEALLDNGILRFLHRREIADIHGNSQLHALLEQQRAHHKTPIVIFTDIDHTFYKFGREEASQKLTEMAQSKHWPIVAISGCDYKSVLRRMQSGELPYFQIIAGSVGTEIWVLQKNTEGIPVYKKDTFFDFVLTRKQFNRKRVAKRSLSLIEKISQVFPGSDFNFQDPSAERMYLEGNDRDAQPFKVSFHFFATGETMVIDIQSLMQKYFPKQAVIVCEEIGHNSKLAATDTRKKYCLDILPVGKGKAFAYLKSMYRVKKGIVAGDSGNDVDMLKRKGSLLGVLVGGYEPLAKKVLLKESGFHDGYVDADPTRQASESILQALRTLSAD